MCFWTSARTRTAPDGLERRMRPGPALAAHPHRDKTGEKQPKTEERDPEGSRFRGRTRDSPVGLGGLVNDVLIGGQQDQSVLGEIHGHVCVPVSIQPAADGERPGLKPGEEREEEEEEAPRQRGDEEVVWWVLKPVRLNHD